MSDNSTTPTATPRRSRRRLALFSALALAVPLLLSQAVTATADMHLASLPGSDFEIDTDANLKVDDAGNLDWANVDATVGTDEPTGRDDDSFAGGSKEDDVCPGTTTGSIPNNKSDLLNFGVYEEEGDPGFLHLFWTRVQEPNGTTLMDFELNQSGEDCGNGVNKVRTDGDLLLEYQIDQGGKQAIVLARLWDEAAGEWGPVQDLTAVNDATGTINETAIPANEAIVNAGDPGEVPLGPLSPRTFGEASIDLGFLFDDEECLSFGSAFLKSRSSDSFTSQLKDYIAPVGVNISNCGKLTVVKQTDPDGVSDTFDFTTTGGLTPATFTLGDDGTQAYTDVFEGTYTVTEAADAPGELDSIVCDSGDWSVADRTVTVNLEADDDITCTFYNSLFGSILVEKVDDNGDPLDGAAFTATAGEDVTDLTDYGNGVFCADVPYGDYTVEETTVPDDYVGEDPKNVTVNSSESCAERLAEENPTPDLTFTNEQLHRIVVLVCHQADDELVVGTVALGEGESQDTVAPSDITPLTDVDPDAEEKLCNLPGFSDLEHGEVGLTVNIPGHTAE
ncbi:MSCRAMM family protein [Isoptericola sediminis]|uniref:Prealbumin-like fold domain-containing protein n=1 Tax=Isoptericola sediminis TaxID=2733572 RepID=A0A849K4R0_9MICO|nr:prealbumin-like fold domain-containing protein [Isoptericola sediminis]NNU27390.1 prealbumin-like fold domain-containing protein [Isoptericola sediminis]